MKTTQRKPAAPSGSPFDNNLVNDDELNPDTSVARTTPKSPFIKRGTPQFIRVTLALFSAGLATFALLYCVQPILPVNIVFSKVEN